MSVVINFVNPNTLALDKIEVYRASSKTGSLSLIASLAGTDLTYTDTTVAANTVNWYVVRGYIGTSYTDSDRIPKGYFPDTGPGPSTIIRGDWEFGYFGTVTDLTTMPRMADMSAVVSAATIPPYTTYTDTMNFHKWVIGGKIVYIPESFYNYSATIKNWGAFGLAVNQDPTTMSKITKGSYKFGVRPPYASTLFTTAINPNNSWSWSSLVAGGTLTNDDGTLAKSEVGAIIRSFLTPDITTFFAKNKFNDIVMNGGFTQLATATFMSSTLSVKIPNVASTVMSAVLYDNTATTAATFWPIFELQFS